MIKVKIILLFIFTGIANISAQNISDNYKVDLPSMPYLSPEAASLGKYGEIPVSEYTMVS